MPIRITWAMGLELVATGPDVNCRVIQAAEPSGECDAGGLEHEALQRLGEADEHRSIPRQAR